MTKKTEVIRRLAEATTVSAAQSSSLRLLHERIEKTEFLRSGWFSEWCLTASQEESMGWAGYIRIFFLDRQRWKALRTVRRILRSRDNFRAFINDGIVRSTIEANKEYFDSVEKNALTQRQREACASGEDATLVIAGAGTGKTSTILAKIGLLIKTGQCMPEEILAISFTNKSAMELVERVKERLDCDVRISTFHKLGLDILARTTGSKPTLAPFAADPVEKSKFVGAVISSLKDDPRFLEGFIEFCAYHRIEPKQSWHFATLAEYSNWLRSNKIISLDGIPKKSFQECLIANWLILNGVAFEYERQYQHTTSTAEYRQYCPDFWLPSLNLYIEHFGIDEEGKTAPFVDAKTYYEGMDWKRAIHEKYGTVLLETYSWEHSKGGLLSGLKEKLNQYGCIFQPMPPDEALNILNRAGIVTQFEALAAGFLTLYKGNGNRLSNSGWADSIFRGRREKLFLELFDPIFAGYENQNRAKSQIDFEDMIVQATKAATSGLFESSYRHILIDEFQDISPGRSELIKAVRASVQECSLFAVGDDWQSIYRFAGSDIGCMTNFSEIFGPTRKISLDTTFRFNDQSADISGKFIIKNKAQIQKDLGAIRLSTV